MNGRFICVSAQPGRVLVGRLLPGADLVPELAALCASCGFAAGAVVSMVGSLAQATYFSVLPAPDTPCGLVYTDPVTVPGPLEIMSVQGTVGQDEAGNVTVHLHAGLVDGAGRGYGGHLAAAGNIVAATVEVFLLETEGVTLRRRYDSKTGFTLFFPARP